MLHPSISEKVRSRRISREVFINEEGAIDLASIMVGIIVIGLIGGVIAATIFAVIPWAQDNAAKQQLNSVKTAEDAYRGLAEDSGVSEYGSNKQLADPTFGTKKHPSLLDLDENKVLITPIPGPPPSYTATVVSQSGKTYQLGPDGKIREVPKPDGGTNPPATVGDLSLAKGSMQTYPGETLTAKPADKANSLLGTATSSTITEFQNFSTFFKSASFSTVNDLFLPEGTKYGYTDYNGQADIYIVRPNTVTITDNKKNQIAQYSGNTGTALAYLKVGDSYSWQFITAYPDAAEKVVSQSSGYVVTMAFDNGNISFAGNNPNVFEPGPTGTGSDVASGPIVASSVNYAPVTDNNGQGFATQDAYDHALVNRDTDFWSFQVTVNNPNPQSLPDLSDVPFVQNPDGTYKAVMKNGRWYKDAVFTFANGNSGMLVGNSDMASVNSDRNDYFENLTITLDENKKVTSLKLDYLGVRVPGYSTLAEAKAKLSGSTVTIYPYATQPNNDYAIVSTTKTMTFTLK